MGDSHSACTCVAQSGDPVFCSGEDYHPEQWPEERWEGGRRLLFLLNHNGPTCDVVLPRTTTELLAGCPLAEQTTLAGKAVMISCEA